MHRADVVFLFDAQVGGVAEKEIDGELYLFMVAKGRTIGRLAGNHFSLDGRPEAANLYYFALAAENAWTAYLYRKFERALAEGELLSFNLKRRDRIEVEPELIRILQGGRTTELCRADIASMTIDDGIVYVFEHGAKEGWLANKGIHQFPYRDLDNARFFLFALENFLGIRL
jgi:hypothetical protein